MDIDPTVPSGTELSGYSVLMAPQLVQTLAQPFDGRTLQIFLDLPTFSSWLAPVKYPDPIYFDQNVIGSADDLVDLYDVRRSVVVQIKDMRRHRANFSLLHELAHAKPERQVAETRKTDLLDSATLLDSNGSAAVAELDVALVSVLHSVLGAIHHTLRALRQLSRRITARLKAKRKRIMVRPTRAWPLGQSLAVEHCLSLN